MRVLHVVSQLGTYGAERFLGMLLAQPGDGRTEQAVLTVGSSPPAALAGLAVPVFDAARGGRYDVAFVARLVAHMRRWRPDVVHTHTHTGKYYGRLAAVLAGVPRIVHTEHNSEFGAPRAFRLLDRLLASRTDAVVTFSQTQRARLVREDGTAAERIVVIPNGIVLRPPPTPAQRAAARAALGAGPGECLLVGVGRLSAVKNQALAVEALALLDGRSRLVLIGDGADRADLAALAAARRLEGRVTFLGYRADAAHLVAGADAVVVTSRNEAMPLTVIEAMTAGTPLVSTPWAGASEMLGAGAYGLVAADHGPASFAAALAELAADPAAARARAERAMTFARTEYDIATTARRHAELYRELSAGTRAAKRRITAARS